MLTAVLRDFDQLILEDRPIPQPGPDEALVRIKSCGICATDYKAIKGIRRNVHFPLVPGHEPAGVVAGVGAHVSYVKEGDEVIISPAGYCGHCRNCRMGLANYCENLYTTGGDGPEDVRPGSFAEYTVTGANTLFPKPKGMSFDAACQTEPLSGAWKGVIHFSEMRVGDDVVIIGTGGIGMYCLMVAKAAGAGGSLLWTSVIMRWKPRADWGRRTRLIPHGAMRKPRFMKSCPLVRTWFSKPPDRSRRSI